MNVAAYVTNVCDLRKDDLKHLGKIVEIVLKRQKMPWKTIKQLKVVYKKRRWLEYIKNF